MDWLVITMLACKFRVLVVNNRFGLDIYCYAGATKVRDVQILTSPSRGVKPNMVQVSGALDENRRRADAD